MKEKAVLGVRLLVGLIFFVFGLNGFLQFLPMPEPTPEVGNFMMALLGTGYFFPLLKITEILCGLLLLANYFVPLALVILAPIVVQIFALHLFLDMSGLPMAIFLVGALAFLGHAYKDHYAPLLKAK